MTRRDEHLWEEEVVEIFLDPNRSGRDYYELEISPANVVCDVRMVSPSPHKEMDIAWNLAGLVTGCRSRRTPPGKPRAGAPPRCCPGQDSGPPLRAGRGVAPAPGGSLAVQPLSDRAPGGEGGSGRGRDRSRLVSARRAELPRAERLPRHGVRRRGTLKPELGGRRGIPRDGSGRHPARLASVQPERLEPARGGLAASPHPRPGPLSCGDEGGRVVATGGTVAHGGRLGWICMILVDAERRGEGLGTQLFADVVAHAGDLAIVGLDATPRGRPVYERAGFEASCPLIRLERAPTPVGRSRRGDRGRPLGLGDLDAVLARDRGVSRRAGRSRWAFVRPPNTRGAPSTRARSSGTVRPARSAFEHWAPRGRRCAYERGAPSGLSPCRRGAPLRARRSCGEVGLGGVSGAPGLSRSPTLYQNVPPRGGRHGRPGRRLRGGGTGARVRIGDAIRTLAAVLLAWLPRSGLGPRRPSQPLLSRQAEVVNVDVVVTDHDGGPVLDLRPGTSP